MITWTEFEQQAPDLAQAGREQLYAFDVALGFLATVRRDGGPRVHPVCPVISPAGLLMLTHPADAFPQGPTSWRPSQSGRP